MASPVERATSGELVSDVLSYWFGDREREWYDPMHDREPIWFGGGDEVDNEIRAKFAVDVERAMTSDRWDALIDGSEHGMRGTLAFVILLDQFTRNIYRGDAKAFAADAKAYKVVADILGSEARMQAAKKELRPIERQLLWLPLMHQESVASLKDSMAVCQSIRDECTAAGRPECAKVIENGLSFGEKHLKILEQFGRYPYRNKVLGRESTLEEEVFLKDGPRFGQ